MTGHSVYPSHGWGALANDPFHDDADAAEANAWDAVVETARATRLALTKPPHAQPPHAQPKTAPVRRHTDPLLPIPPEPDPAPR